DPSASMGTAWNRKRSSAKKTEHVNSATAIGAIASSARRSRYNSIASPGTPKASNQPNGEGNVRKTGENKRSSGSERLFGISRYAKNSANLRATFPSACMGSALIYATASLRQY